MISKLNHLVTALTLFALAALNSQPSTARAQTVLPEVLYVFTNGPAFPQGGVVQGPDGAFYGTSSGGGGSGVGTVFKTTGNGLPLTLVNFNFYNGATPYAGLTLASDGNFYGTTYGGGSTNINNVLYSTASGTVFKMTTNGVLTTLYSFPDTFVTNSAGLYTNATGVNPNAGVTMGRDRLLYGTAKFGGTNGRGTVFKMTTNGLITTLLSFQDINQNSTPAYTNNTGALPGSILTQGPDGNFYGTTTFGGTNGSGTIFKITTNGSLTTLIHLGGSIGACSGLTLGSNGIFYGYGGAGGTNVSGSVFKMTTNGTITILYSFTPGVYSLFYQTYVNDDGMNPYGLPTFGNDGNLYGFAYSGGSQGKGTVFQVTTNGVLTPLYTFVDSDVVNNPIAGLTLAIDGNLFGTTSGGGLGYGTVFLMNTNAELAIYTWFNRAPTVSQNLTPGNDGSFYGTTADGGTNDPAYGGAGTVFNVTTNGLFTTLASFNGTNGLSPNALTLDGDGSFYGTTAFGGTNGLGNVIKVTTNGVLTPLVDFDGTNGYGAPGSTLTLGDDGSFYGTTADGGTNGFGNVFKVTTNGIVTSLAYFNGTNGASPAGSLTQGGDHNFYGITSYGGASYSGTNSGYGTVFKITTNGILTSLYSFLVPHTNLAGLYTNVSGVSPEVGLTLGNDGILYGTTSSGGINGYGTFYKITTNGFFTTLLNFAATNKGASGLTLASDSNFYGTTYYGGIDPNNFQNNNRGLVFQVTTNGGLRTLANFDFYRGEHPDTGLALGRDGYFYGSTFSGGAGGGGGIYRVPGPVSIKTQPADQSAVAGNNVTLTVVAISNPGYQWQRNGTNIPNASQAALALTNVQATNAGSYTVVVSNYLNSVTSRVATLAVTVPPNFSIITTNGNFGFTNKQFRFTLIGPAGSNAIISASTNLQNWVPLATNPLIGGSLTFTDTLASNFTRRFYRATLLP